MTLDNDDDDRGQDIIISFWIQGGLAVFVICLRFWARNITKAIGWDDWLMLLTLVMYLALSSMVTYSATIGGFRHLYSLSDSQREEVLRWNYIYQVLAVWTVTPGKASVAWQIYRIVRPNKDWVFWTLLIWTLILTFFNTSNCFFTFFQCDPVDALWDQSIEDASCWPASVQTSYAITTSTVNVFVDIILAVIPATIVRKLQMESNKKISLAVLLGLSLCAALVGTIKTAYLANLGERADLTWNVYELVLLAGAEIFVIIVCGSIPTIRPLWVRYIAPMKIKQPVFCRIRRGRTTSPSESELCDYDIKYVSELDSTDRSTSDSTNRSTILSNTGEIRHLSVELALPPDHEIFALPEWMILEASRIR